MQNDLKNDLKKFLLSFVNYSLYDGVIKIRNKD
jgi:hypothetical protein